MDLFEYQAKELFAEYGVPVQRGRVASTAEEAREIAAGFAAEGSPLVVVKAQVKTGGRGKAGGVKLANGPDEAEAKARQILGMDIKGHTVHRVLIAEASDIARSPTFLPARPGCPDLHGHMLVQAAWRSRKSAHQPRGGGPGPRHPLVGVDRPGRGDDHGRPDPAGGGAAAALLAERLCAVFTDGDAPLVEVNPVALTEPGVVLAVHGK